MKSSENSDFFSNSSYSGRNNYDGNGINKSPYSHLYEESNNTTEKLFTDPYNNSKSSGQINFVPSNQESFSSTSILPQNEDIKSYYFSKVRNDINLLPNEFKNKMKFYNNIFVISTLLYPLYTLFHITLNYPSFSEQSRRKVLLASGIYFGLFILINKKSDEIYESSYQNMRSKYSPDKIREILKEYHLINTGVVNNSINPVINQKDGNNIN
jgi:hypothetical protein